MTAAAPKPLRCSPQQLRVLQGIRVGKSYGDLARQLGIKRETVAVYVERMAAKLDDAQVPNPEQLRPYLRLFSYARASMPTEMGHQLTDPAEMTTGRR